MKVIPICRPAPLKASISAGYRVISFAAPATLFLLAACSGRTVVQDRPVTVLTPVAVPCALERPAKPGPLPGNWDALDVRQKAAAVGKAAIEWRDYGEALDAATAGCK